MRAPRIVLHKSFMSPEQVQAWCLMALELLTVAEDGQSLHTTHRKRFSSWEKGLCWKQSRSNAASVLGTVCRVSKEAASCSPPQSKVEERRAKRFASGRNFATRQKRGEKEIRSDQHRPDTRSVNLCTPRVCRKGWTRALLTSPGNAPQRHESLGIDVASA